MYVIKIPESVWANILLDVARLQATVRQQQNLLNRSTIAMESAGAALDSNAKRLEAQSNTIVTQQRRIQELEGRLDGYVSPDHLREIEIANENLLDERDQEIAKQESRAEGWREESIYWHNQFARLKTKVQLFAAEVEDI